MALLIRNGEIITHEQRLTGDILVQGETISAVGPNLSAPPDAEMIDATGRYVFPGFIDPHVHIHLPFMGTFAKDDYTSGSRAALAGGTTTMIEMICPSRQDAPREAFETWSSKAAGRSACDYSFHLGVTRFDDLVAQQVREIVAEGITSLKVFLAYKGVFGIDDAELYQTLALARELGVVVAAHCENATLIERRQRELLAAGKTGPEFHEPSRPVQVEAEGVHHFLTFAELTGARGYIVHLSCREALQRAVAARRRGVQVGVETLIQYLLLDRTYAERPDFEGAKYVMSPPLRDASQQEALWNGLATGLIDTVATDHAPFDSVGQKELGRDDFTKIPNGIPSLEDRVNLLYTYGVKRGRLSLHQMVNVLSTNAAKWFGLFPRKGTIQPGADADLVIYDPTATRTICAATHQSAVDYNAFEGWPIEGCADTVLVRGTIQIRDGVFVGRQDHGQLLRRDCGS